jgi:hypothetical protein
MKLSALDLAMLAASFLGEIVLFSILITRRRWREFPVFTVLIGFETALDPIGYTLLLHGGGNWYARVYWSSDLIEFLLQLGVISEVARIVMRPTGTWLRDARKQFILGSVVGLLLAGVLAWLFSPPVASIAARLEAQGDLFTDLVVCELFVVMLLTAKRLGLGLRNHVFALVIGWSGWVMAAMAVDLLHDYYGTHFYYDALENLRKVAYLAALLYWIVQFWLEEPARQELPAEMRAYILALHQRVNKDIDRLSTQR